MSESSHIHEAKNTLTLFRHSFSSSAIFSARSFYFYHFVSLWVEVVLSLYEVFQIAEKDQELVKSDVDLVNFGSPYPHSTCHSCQNYCRQTVAVRAFHRDMCQVRF